MTSSGRRGLAARAGEGRAGEGRGGGGGGGGEGSGAAPAAPMGLTEPGQQPLSPDGTREAVAGWGGVRGPELRYKRLRSRNSSKLSLANLQPECLTGAVPKPDEMPALLTAERSRWFRKAPYS